MMTAGLRIVLLVFALVGFGAGGASLAVARYRLLADGARDIGMLCVAAMLAIFGTLCAAVGLGLSGIPAFGMVIGWASYVLMAQHMGLFRIDVGSDLSSPLPPARESRRAR